MNYLWKNILRFPTLPAHYLVIDDLVVGLIGCVTTEDR